MIKAELAILDGVPALIAWNGIGIVISGGSRHATIRKAAPPNNGFG